MLPFELSITPKIRMGEGAVASVGECAAGYGNRALVVVGSRSLEAAGIVDELEGRLAERGISVTRFRVHGEPDTDTVDRGAREAREAACEQVIGIGGGSALDTAKAIAGLLANGGECLDYLEVVGRGRRLERPALPWIAIPTTGGTGSEATHNAVLTHRESHTKASLRNPTLLPRLAILDPRLGLSVPAAVTASTGLDALTQLIEPYVSRRAHPATDAIAMAGMQRAARALPRAFLEPDDLEARSDMLVASLLSGIALAHAGLGAAHGIAGPVGGSFSVPHGFACAALLPHVMTANLRATGRSERAPKASASASVPPREPREVLRRYADVAEAIGAARAGSDLETAERGIGMIRGFCERMEVPPLSRFGVTAEAVPDLVARSRLTSSMKANPVDLADEELTEILVAAIG